MAIYRRQLSHGLRANALQRISKLSAYGDSKHGSDLEQLCELCPETSADELDESRSLGTVGPAELEVLFALCDAASLLETTERAAPLLQQLGQYLTNVYARDFDAPTLEHTVNPSPWETLTYRLTKATLNIGIKHDELHPKAIHLVNSYLGSCLQALRGLRSAAAGLGQYDLGLQGGYRLASIAISLLGFMDAAAQYADFFRAAEQLDILRTLRDILDEDFLIKIEGTFSSMRSSESDGSGSPEWTMYSKRYAATGRPLGAMILHQSFMRLSVSYTSLQLCSPAQLRETDIFHVFTVDKEVDFPRPQDASNALVEYVTELTAESMSLLEDGSDYLQLSSTWQQHLSFSVKAYTLHAYVNCMIYDEEIADLDMLMSWLDDALADPLQMSDNALSSIVLKSMAIVAKKSPCSASAMSRSLPRFLVQGGIHGDTVITAARSLTFILRQLSQDATITGLYTLGNVLSSNKQQTDRSSRVPDSAKGINGYSKHSTRDAEPLTRHSIGSAISLHNISDEDTSMTYSTIIQAIVTIATSCQDEKIAALAQSMLLQKLGRVSLSVDLLIIKEAAVLAIAEGEAEFKALLKLYNRLTHDGVRNRDSVLLTAVRDARLYIAHNLSHTSPFYPLYLVHLLETIISKGDVHEGENTHQADVDLAAREIVQLLPALAALASVPTETVEISDDENVARLHREAWFNVVVHGITPSSVYGQSCSQELQILATKSRALIDETQADDFESEIELNTVLRRGMNPAHTADQKQKLTSLLPQRESDIRSLSYPKVIFLNTAYLVEHLRAQAGDCTHILTYFLDPSLNGSAMENCMTDLASSVVSLYLQKMLGGPFKSTLATSIADQLAGMFKGCCHRIFRVQEIAASSADRIVTQIPAALCQKSSLFALLELLTMMWTSCLEAELDEYELKSTYISSQGGHTIELSDDYNFRRSTLDRLYRRARKWVTMAINTSPLDVKGILQTYLSEYEDDGAYGHIALGRSFAVEMGSIIPSVDQKLIAIDRHGDCNINTASDLIAQYTTRLEYKYADAIPDYGQDWAKFLQISDEFVDGKPGSEQEAAKEETLLAHVERRALAQKFISIGELRDILRRAAALLCRSRRDEAVILQHLIRIPFILFTKQSIKLGLSLWLGILNENPLMEPKILALIAECWESSIRDRSGVFSSKLRHLDPFHIKEEFSPSDKESLIKIQQSAQNLIAPHLRLLQFTASHFNSSRLNSPHSHRIFHRMAVSTLKGLTHSFAHPLSREFWMQALLFGLNILQNCPGLNVAAKWRLKDSILSSGLSWFKCSPRWSFGGNRLQIKAEVRLMSDVDAMLCSSRIYCESGVGSYQALGMKQDLLSALLQNEQMRLTVWLYPLDHEKRNILSYGSVDKMSGEHTITSSLLKFAWTEDPGLAVQIAKRYGSTRLLNEVRNFLLQAPERAIDEPDALQILVGASLPPDISFQLKYLLYWAPVNPITAVTYFLPEYNQHPFIIQYATRALESHAVDITFFYVPQIVQTLRYDSLGYVQRYIVETAQFSQLFAHQIIWNMTANAFKDEDSTIEDSLKPTLDLVKERMLESFSETDKAFFLREFSFFDEVTGISGKLRPFIKRSKAEKKQKIEEELRKIKVEVGVYLPSNPDGTVIGIDRKSGKPLQSHAKAPYMATFRIKKNRGPMEATDDMLEKTNQNIETTRDDPVSKESTYEVWQSAIFKVGDDCRQDVLALQLIAAFRGIFNDVGLDVYVYPYRVTATAPGCGVIDVLPNSISRDMLGREAVNGLYDYFISKYGAENSIRFQEARNNFVKSMAAYSVISYLLQFKDRHNGNIMVDDAGHILHIDFGFCFDIAPGGVRFERAPFKLTSEMVAVMGGSTTSQSYKWFEELCIKAFLASRQHAEKLCHLVVLMLGSGLPCFKPETITHLRQRFVLEKSEREAADFMRDLVKKSYSSYSTKGYDQFQLLTNGIPY